MSLKESGSWELIVRMQDAEPLSLEQSQAFLEANEEVQLKGKKRQEVHDWMTRLMRRQEYRKNATRQFRWRMPGPIDRFISLTSTGT
jgi:hypothetical protein